MTTKPAGRALFATVAAIAIIALFGALALIATHGPKAVQMPAGTPGTPKGQWQQLDALTNHTLLSSNGSPAVARTNPNVVYETHQGAARADFTLRRTDDGGKTWHALTLPVDAASVQGLDAEVSPLDARTVFLFMIAHGNAAENCPTYAAIFEGAGLCRLRYVSHDGGVTWQPVQTRVEAGLSEQIYPQGSRLFATAECETVQCTRIVRSDDGGTTWQAADAQALWQSNIICDFGPAVSGSTLYAATTTTTENCGYPKAAHEALWRSDDAGAHWVQVTTLPVGRTAGFSIQGQGAGQPPLVYTLFAHLATTKDKMGGEQFATHSTSLMVSADGGKTWATSPAAGAPSGEAPFWQVIGINSLKDGSVVVPFSEPGANAQMSVSFNTWRIGDTAWHKIAPDTNQIVDSYVVAQQDGKDILWVSVRTPANGQGNDWQSVLKLVVKENEG